MKIYNVLFKDRHFDTTATPFLDREEAKKWAKKQAKKYCRFAKDLKEESVEGCLYYIKYSCEGDCLWITEHEI